MVVVSVDLGYDNVEFGSAFILKGLKFERNYTNFVKIGPLNK
jgi:hypothetical protein